ncbi:hypothetical protein [Yeosuana marina]|uniref:hypothetical protein n=1 Tax=Yeosuana marina TaxID=1565536 RepID=UPI0030EE1D8D
MIELKEENTFMNHLWTVISRDFRVKGEISSNKIKLWKQGFWSMSIYPIFTFEFNTENHLINITDKQNPIGKLFRIFFLLPLVIVVFAQIINGFDFIANLKFITLFGIIISLLILLTRKVYNYEKQNQLEIIYDLLDIEGEEKTIEKEWSNKKIITRIFMYPFCIGLILLAIFLLIPNGEIIKGIVSIGIAGAYLFADIKILFRKKTTGNTV